MDASLHAYLRDARANLDILSRRARIDTDHIPSDLFLDLLSEYETALRMLLLSTGDGPAAPSVIHPTSPAMEFYTVVDASGKFVYVSSGCMVLGYSPEDLVGKDSFDYVHQADVEAIASRFAYGVQHPKETIDTSFRFRAADNHWVRLQLRSQNLGTGKDIDGFISRCRVLVPEGMTH